MRRPSPRPFLLRKLLHLSPRPPLLLRKLRVIQALAKALACSVAVDLLPGGKLKEIVLQGPHLASLQKHLVAEFGIPPTVIQSSDKTKK